MFSMMIEQATMRSYLDLPEKVRVQTKPKPAVKEKRGPYITETTTQMYLDSFIDGKATVKQIAERTGRNLCTVQRHVRELEKRGVIKIVGRAKTSANPPIIWGIV